MLVLSRKVNEEILLGKDISIKIIAISDTQVRIGITAPPEVQILRAELLETVKENIIEASKLSSQKIEELNKLKINKKTDKKNNGKN